MENLKRLGQALIALVTLIILYLTSHYSYLLFHSIAEIFSICIAFTVFLLTWNSQKYIRNNYLVLVGVAYLFIGLLDLFHTLAYKGMAIFKDYDYYANQLWIATRYMESLTLLLAFSVINYRKQVNGYLLFTVYTAVTTLIIFSVFIWRIFPVCFINGYGLTTFKKISEYIISAILAFNIYLLYKFKDKFAEKIYLYLTFSLAFAIVSELAFTFYIDNYGISNLIGHYFKIFSFYCVYKAIIEQGVRTPYESTFRELKLNQEMLKRQNKLLEEEAITDGLTRLYNHRFLYERLQEEIERSKRYHNHLSIIMFDIDSFKRINDTFGHQKGDGVIVTVAKAIKENIRTSDIAGRYGGEEFLIILPHTQREQAYGVAQKIREFIAALDLGHELRVTVSGGVAEYTDGKASDFIKQADEKLYRAKNEGRNRVD